MSTTEYAGLDADELAAHAETHLTTLLALLDELDRLVDVQVDRDSLAALLVGLRDVKTSAARVFANAERALLSEAGEKTFDVAGLGRFEAKKSIKRSAWRFDELVPVLVAKANEERHYDANTGTVEGEGEAVARVLRDCVSFGYGKVTGLRARGIDVDEWCQVDGEAWSIVLPKRVEQ